MNEVASLLGIGAALCVGAASPGPSFIMVARTAASAGRTNGLNAALGMGFGALIFALAALLGLNAILSAIPALYAAVKFVGGLYLVYLGFCIWRGAKHPLVYANTTSERSALSKSYLLLGLATQVSNPKTAVVYVSVFAAFLPTSPSLQYHLAVIALVFFIEAGWYAIVATALSAEIPRSTYLRYKTWVDRAAGGIMVALGLKLAVSSSQ